MAWFEHGTSRIYYEESGSGDPVLLLPGWAGNINEFPTLREALETAGYRVIAADLPGSGQSEPQPRTYPASYYEDDAQSFAALLQYLSVGPTHLLGFSDGGEVELLMAALTPDVARSLVTWGAAGMLADPGGHLRDAMYNMIDNPIEPMRGFREYLIASYGEANARAMTRNFVSAMNGIVDGRGGDISLSKADAITCPVLLIVGEHDFIITPDLVSQLASRIPGAEFLVVEGAGHDVHNTRPELFAQTLLDWLGRN